MTSGKLHIFFKITRAAVLSFKYQLSEYKYVQNKYKNITCEDNVLGYNLITNASFICCLTSTKTNETCPNNIY